MAAVTQPKAARMGVKGLYIVDSQPRPLTSIGEAWAGFRLEFKSGLGDRLGSKEDPKA